MDRDAIIKTLRHALSLHGADYRAIMPAIQAIQDDAPSAVSRARLALQPLAGNPEIDSALRAIESRGGARPGAGRPAGRDPAKSSSLIVRIEPSRKASYVRAAAGEPLAAWVTRHLDQDAGYQPPN